MPLMGQLVVLKRNKGMASPYTCFMCGCGLSYICVDVTPMVVNLLVAGTYWDVATAMYFNCNGATLYYTVTNSAYWWASLPAIAKVNNTTQKGLVTGQSGRTTPIYASFTDQVVDNAWYPDYACHYYDVDCGDNNTANVVTVSISGPANVPLRASGSSGPNSINLTATGTPSGGSYSWSSTSSRVTLSNTTSATVTVTSASASSAVGDVPVTVTYTYNGKSSNATQNVTVRKPTSLYVESDTTDPNGKACSVNCLDGSPGCG